jgi:REP element-mobilizing transposase RayT
MQISAYGKVLVDQWNWLREHYPNIALDEFVVMPNHFHAIVRIVGTGHELHSTELTRPKTKSLSELIGAFKTTTSKQIHRLGMVAFQW